MDGLFSEDDYRGQKQSLEMELESLVVPEVDAAADAGKMLKRLPELWEGASLNERHELAVRMLDGVYVDLKDARSIVGIKPSRHSAMCSGSRPRVRGQESLFCL